MRQRVCVDFPEHFTCMPVFDSEQFLVSFWLEMLLRWEF